jgi:hypothetical protein
MGHKGYYGQYSGNSKFSKDHAHTRVTSGNYKATERDDAAHIDYLKRDIDYDNKHGHSDEKMTADEKHISKLAGDMKYDKKHHGSPAKSSGNRNDHDMSESYWKAHKNTEHGRKAHGDMSVNEKQVAAEKNRKFPKKDTEKTYSQKKVSETIKNRKNK